MRAAHHTCCAQEVVSHAVVHSFVNRRHMFEWNDAYFIFSKGYYTASWQDKNKSFFRVLSKAYEVAGKEAAVPPATGAEILSAEERKLLLADNNVQAKVNALKSALRAASIDELCDEQISRIRNSARRGIMLSSGDFFLNLAPPVKLFGHAKFDTITPDIQFPPLVLKHEVMPLALPKNYTLPKLLAVDSTEVHALIKNILGDSADAFLNDLATTMQCAPLKAVWVLYTSDRSRGRSALAELLSRLVISAKIVRKEYLPCFCTGKSPCQIGLQQLSGCHVMFLDDMPDSLPVDFGLVKPWQNLSRDLHLPSPVPPTATVRANMQALFIISGNAKDPRQLVKNVDSDWMKDIRCVNLDDVQMDSMLLQRAKNAGNDLTSKEDLENLKLQFVGLLANLCGTKRATDHAKVKSMAEVVASAAGSSLGPSAGNSRGARIGGIADAKEQTQKALEDMLYTLFEQGIKGVDNIRHSKRQEVIANYLKATGNTENPWSSKTVTRTMTELFDCCVKAFSAGKNKKGKPTTVKGMTGVCERDLVQPLPATAGAGAG